MIEENKNFKIMIVDDSKFMRMLLEDILKKEGYTVKSYERALIAKDDLDKFSPHLILSDFLMPEMNGYEFCEYVKKEKKYDVKFILVTSVTDVDNKVKCFEVGADDYITKPFNAKEVIARVATHLKIKILTDRLQNALERINKDLEIVRFIQLSLVPEKFPQFENLKFTYYYNIMHKTGGDYLDYLILNDSKLGVIVADVEGHGIYSTVFMAIIKTIVNTDLKKIIDTSDALTLLNNDILSLTKETKFATVFYGIIDIENLVLSYSNAGHHEPVLINRKNGEISLLKCKKGFPVGLFKANSDTYGSNKINLKKGDRIFIFTDGILEAKNDNGELFGEKRFLELVKNTKDLNSEDAKELILERINEFANKNLDDDITLLIIDVV